MKADSIRKAIFLALFVLSIGYVAQILSVAIHEILGHGLSAVLLGGSFSGLVLKWDGMGWAFCDLPSRVVPAHHVLYLASGVVAEIFGGLLFLGLTGCCRKRPDIQLPLLVTLIALVSWLGDGVRWN